MELDGNVHLGAGGGTKLPVPLWPKSTVNCRGKSGCFSIPHIKGIADLSSLCLCVISPPNSPGPLVQGLMTFHMGGRRESKMESQEGRKMGFVSQIKPPPPLLKDKITRENHSAHMWILESAAMQGMPGTNLGYFHSFGKI